jgi:hypothetical protein
MAYQQNLADFRYQGIPGNKRNLIDLVAKSLEMEHQIAQQNAATRQNDLTGDFDERTMDSRVGQQANQQTQGDLQNQGLRLGMPEKQLGAAQAGVESNYLEQMFPGSTKAQAPSLPPPMQGMSMESDGPQMPPVIGNRFAAKTLAELRALKADAGPAGEFLGKFIDPMIKVRSDAEEMGPALQEITAAANLPGGTREEARSKSAALSAVLSKYPAIAADPRIKEALSTAMPRNPDVTMDPFRAAGAERSKTQQVIGLENQLRDEYEKAATESRTIARAGQDIAAALNTNNSLSIGTAITKFSKIKDPTTGVLGGEADATEKMAMGDAWNRIQGLAQKNLVGGATPETVKSFRDATKDLMRVQKEIFSRVQERSKNRFGSYASRFPDLGLSMDAVMGTEGDRAKEMEQFNVFPEAKATQHPDAAKNARLQELRAKEAAGTLGGKP